MYLKRIVLLAFFGILPGNLFVEAAAQESKPHYLFAPKESVDDPRFQPLRSLNSYFPFEPPQSTQEWKSRAERLREKIRFSLGLIPEPTRTPLNAVIHGRIDQGDYTVEKVYFESMPGFFVTGNLYRPKEPKQGAPGVLCPHGHYSNGRFHEATREQVESAIASGAEEFPENARSPLQARCAHLARMGCTVFHCDMIGYADSQQIPSAIAHGFAAQRPHMNGPDGWGFFSPRAEAHSQSIMGLQTWNSIRALDFLESLAEVSPDRLAVTGSSGGGTQTFVLCAIDPRPVAGFPAVMVSTAMQGGCTCENCCYLRIGTGNVEIAGLFAPKPMGLTAADDWTREMTAKGFPELQQLYKMLGAPDNVHLTSRTEFPHNYNQVCREAMYRWFDKHLGLGGDVEERPIEFLTPQELTVWNDDHPQPKGGEDFEQQLLESWARDITNRQEQQSHVELHSLVRRQLSNLLDDPASSKSAGRRVAGEAKLDDGSVIRKLMVTYGDRALPSLELIGASFDSEKGEIVVLSGQGKACLFEQDGQTIHEDIQRLLQAGYKVHGIDLYLTGELVPESGSPDPANRIVENGREAPAYTYGYNLPVFLERVLDCRAQLATIGQVPLSVVALDDMAPVAVVAMASVPNQVDRLVVNVSGFRFADVADYRAANCFPGGSRLGDIPAFLGATGARSMLVIGESRSRLEGHPGFDSESFSELVFTSQAPDESVIIQRAVSWILDQ